MSMIMKMVLLLVLLLSSAVGNVKSQQLNDALPNPPSLINQVPVVLQNVPDNSSNNKLTDKLPPKPNGPVFGTRNGYDVGGTEPLCWNSIFAQDGDLMSNKNMSSMEKLNEQMFEAENADVKLLSECPNATSMTMTPLVDEKWLTKDADNVVVLELYTGETYSFRLNVELNLVNVLNENNGGNRNNSNNNLTTVLIEQGEMFIHCRLHLCDAMQQGFCNPLKDTREHDESMTKAETDVDDSSDDVGHAPSSPKLTQDDKWAYTEGTALIGLNDHDDHNEKSNGGGTIYTRWIRWKLREGLDESGVFSTQVDMSLQLPRATTSRGAYFFLGHVVVDFDLGNGNIQRLDIAQTIPEKIVHVRPPPKILTVTKSTKAWLGVAIGVVGAFGLYVLFFILHHRAHEVMKLAQGRFLAAMAGACLLQTVFSVTYLPTHNVFCQLRGPLVQIPFTFVGSILVGRVWRIYTTLNAANSLGRSNAKKSSYEQFFVRVLDCLVGLPTCYGTCSRRAKQVNARSSIRSSAHASKSFRRVVTAEETASLIFILTLPQVILQVVGSIFLIEGLETEFTSDGDVGRVVCSSVNRWVNMTGTGIAAFVFFLAVIMAWISRELPSAFNEKDQIFHAASIGMTLACMSIALGQITDEPTTNPDVLVSTVGWHSIHACPCPSSHFIVFLYLAPESGRYFCILACLLVLRCVY